MIVNLTKYQIKDLYNKTKKEKYYFPETTKELLILCNVNYQEKYDYYTKKMEENNGLLKTADYFFYEMKRDNLLKDDCWDLQWKLNHFDEEIKNELDKIYEVDIDDEDCCYIDKLEE